MRRTTRSSRSWASARCRSGASCGSSATTSARSRRPATSASRRAPRCRLRYAYIVRCVGVDKDAEGRVTAVHCTYDPATRSGTAGADARKVKGNIHWLCATGAAPAEVRLYDRLFRVPFPGARNPWGARGDAAAAEPEAPAKPVAVAGDDDVEPEVAERNYLDDLNPESKRVIAAYVEAALAAAPPESRFQFERHGYYVADLADHAPGKPVYNRAVTLKDSWTRPVPGA